MITRSSIAFEDLLASSIALQLCHPGIESIFVEVLRRYDTNYSKQHIGLFEGHIKKNKIDRAGNSDE